MAVLISIAMVEMTKVSGLFNTHRGSFVSIGDLPVSSAGTIVSLNHVDDVPPP
jgi:hypothetical protein